MAEYRNGYNGAVLKTKNKIDAYRMNENLQKGILTELKCQTWCLEHGYNVSVPMLSDRYDFIIDVKSKLYRIQVKTSRLATQSSFTFNCKSTHAQSKGNKSLPYTSNEIDFYMTMWDNKFYLIPVQDCGVSVKTLRFAPITQKEQIKNCALANQYLAEEVLSQL